jgi:hypothetical protein
VGRVWGAHGNKAVVDLQWKVDEREGGWLGSAGADRAVQVRLGDVDSCRLMNVGKGMGHVANMG